MHVKEEEKEQQAGMEFLEKGAGRRSVEQIHPLMFDKSAFQALGEDAHPEHPRRSRGGPTLSLRAVGPLPEETEQVERELATGPHGASARGRDSA